MRSSFSFLSKSSSTLAIPFVELLTSWLSAPQFVEDMRDFDLSIAKREDVGIEAGDLFRDPALGVLAVKEDVEQGIDRSEFGEGKQGHHRRAGDREPEPNLVAPCELHQADEVFHSVRELPRT